MEKHSQLCDTCQRVKLENYFSLAEYPGTLELGPFQDIAKRDYCPLCRLVIQALNGHARHHWKTGIYPVEVCYLGRYDSKSSRPVLEVWFDSTSETLPKGMSGHSTTLAQIIPLRQQPQQDEYEAGSTSSVELVGERVDFTRIQNWIRCCVSQHGPKCNAQKRQVVESPELRLLLIDVSSTKIVECGWDSRYLALSYVWGSSKGLKSTKANIHHLKTDGALLKLRGELPRAIRDAIDFTVAVGETYLWIDALCIVQDDDSSKATYISRMNEIYGGALVTLVTLNEPSVESGLPGVAESRVLVQSPFEMNGLNLVPRLPQLSDVQQVSAWSHRAWTFQEGILSKRCLYFADHQVFWQCRTTYQSEDCPDDHDQDASDFERGRSTNALERETGNDFRFQFNIYESLVKQYSPKALTFPVDSLFAFAGVLSALSDMFGWKFASALPETGFDMALLWRPMFSASLRSRPPSAESTDPSFCKSPTWCWTAWQGNIFWDPWRLDSFAGQRISVKTEVESFRIQDSGGLRHVCRGGDLDSRDETSDDAVIQRVAAGSTLLFEARTINSQAYSMLAPRLDQCALWNGEIAGGGLSSYFRNQVSHSFWIFDSAGQHCGTLPGIWPDEWPTREKEISRYDLVLLSRSAQDEVTETAWQDYKDYLPLEYPSDSEYYEEIFDTRHYKYKTDWALNIMLIRWGNGLAERVAVGQMHVDAWKSPLEETKLITLA